MASSVSFEVKGPSQQIHYELIPLDVVVDVLLIDDDIFDEGIVALIVATTYLDCSHFNLEFLFAAPACVNFIHEFRADFGFFKVNILSQRVVSLVQLYADLGRDYRLEFFCLVPHCQKVEYFKVDVREDGGVEGADVLFVIENFAH